MPFKGFKARGKIILRKFMRFSGCGFAVSLFCKRTTNRNKANVLKRTKVLPLLRLAVDC